MITIYQGSGVTTYHLDSGKEITLTEAEFMELTEKAFNEAYASGYIDGENYGKDAITMIKNDEIEQLNAELSDLEDHILRLQGTIEDLEDAQFGR